MAKTIRIFIQDCTGYCLSYGDTISNIICRIVFKGIFEEFDQPESNRCRLYLGIFSSILVTALQ